MIHLKESMMTDVHAVSVKVVQSCHSFAVRIAPRPGVRGWLPSLLGALSGPLSVNVPRRIVTRGWMLAGLILPIAMGVEARAQTPLKENIENCFAVLCGVEGPVRQLTFVTGAVRHCDQAIDVVRAGGLCAGFSEPFTVYCPVNCTGGLWNAKPAQLVEMFITDITVVVGKGEQPESNLSLNGRVIVRTELTAPNIVSSEILSMALSGHGVSLIAGAGAGQAAPLSPSIGSIVATEVCMGGTSPGAACTIDADCAGGGQCAQAGAAVIGLFFEIDVGGGNFAYNQEPLTLAATVTTLPFYNVVFTFDGSIELFDQPQGGGLVGRVLSVRLDMGPEPPFPPTGTGVCVPPSGICIDALTPERCAELGFDYRGDGTLCETEIANARIPAVSTWGILVLTLALLAGGKVYFSRRRSARTAA